MTTIKSVTGEALYTSEKPLKEALEEAVTKGVSLQNADRGRPRGNRLRGI